MKKESNIYLFIFLVAFGVSLLAGAPNSKVNQELKQLEEETRALDFAFAKNKKNLIVIGTNTVSGSNRFSTASFSESSFFEQSWSNNVLRIEKKQDYFTMYSLIRTNFSLQFSTNLVNWVTVIPNLNYYSEGITLTGIDVAFIRFGPAQ